MAKYDEQVARALAGAHNTARGARPAPDFVRVGAGLGSAFVWGRLGLAGALRAPRGRDPRARRRRPPGRRPPARSPRRALAELERGDVVAAAGPFLVLRDVD